MADIKSEFRTADTLTITLASLANNAGRGSTAIDNSSTKDITAKVYVRIRTASSGVSSNGFVSVWFIGSADGTNYEDNFGGTDAAFTPVNSKFIGILTANANNTTYAKVFNLDDLGLELPPRFSIGVYNQTGASLSSTAGDHAVVVRRIYKTVN